MCQNPSPISTGRHENLLSLERLSHTSKGHANIEHTKHLDNFDLSRPIGDLREQKPTWESYSKGFLIHLATSGSRVWPVTFIIIALAGIFLQMFLPVQRLSNIGSFFQPKKDSFQM